MRTGDPVEVRSTSACPVRDELRPLLERVEAVAGS
jgi:hypothetical protein